MRYSLPAHNLYGNAPIMLDIPDNWDVRVHSYAGENAPSLTEAQMEEKISSPVNAKPITQGAKGCKNAVIILDDFSRPTPCGAIARIVIRGLEEAGVPRDKIQFIFATGAHRAMSREEYVRKLDEELVSEFRIYNHNPFYNNTLVGHGLHNIPIELNTEVVRADYKVAVGMICPHPSTGLCGGGKTIVPGVASLETIRRFHLYPKSGWDLSSDMRTIGNQAIDFLGLDLKIDTLLNGAGEIAEIYAGYPQSVVNEKLPAIKDFYRVENPEPADLVLVNNYFKPSEPRLPLLTNPDIFNMVRPGGDVILSSHTPLGAAAHYLLGKWGDSQTGGPMYLGKRKLPEHINRYFAYSLYHDKGHGAAYHFDPDSESHIWVSKWEEILEHLGDAPRRVVILPYAGVGWTGDASGI